VTSSTGCSEDCKSKELKEKSLGYRPLVDAAKEEKVDIGSELDELGLGTFR
jgi:hypothetical protein